MASPDSFDAPKLHIDDDWKAQAQAEKKRLSEKSAPPAPAPGGGSARGNTPAAATAGETGDVPASRAAGERRMPAADFETMVSTFASQALYALGLIPDPQTGQPMLHLDLARHQIDMLVVLETKTKNNLSDEETRMLAGTLYELRSRYVQVASAAREKP